jgi:hypothetical protein
MAFLSSSYDTPSQHIGNGIWPTPGENPTPACMVAKEREPKHNAHEYWEAPRLQANVIRDQQPIWSFLPRFSEPTCNMDHLIIDLLEANQLEEDQRERYREFSKKSFPSVDSLLNPILYDPQKPVASMIARHVAKIVMVYTIPEKIALLYMICILTRVRYIHHNYSRGLKGYLIATVVYLPHGREL